jgi:DNA-binding NtrC family response regulator
MEWVQLVADLSFLIVDDEPILREILTEILRTQFACQILSAEDGAQALQILEDASVSLIITDYIMPRMDGVEMLEKLHERGLTIPTLILCGKQDKRLAGAIQDFGAIFLRKPMDEEKLIETIRNRLLASS